MPARAASGPDQRAIRVFVSSTFRDMQEDRDELVKHIFPRLRKLCESRGVTWGEVDLRWGIPDEEKAEGKVLPICLAEIRACRPYFLGLLGERYGWVPDEIDPVLVEQEHWLAEHLGKSVTELEVLHGVLNDPAMADHAFFYFRDPAYADKPALREGPTEEEVARHGAEEAEHRAAARREKLEILKQRIRDSGLPIRKNYADPHALGQLVLADLTAVVDQLYPEDEPAEPLDREAAEHEAFAQSRAGVYIGRPEYFAALDRYVKGDGPPLVVLGESGSGKSALLASWGTRYRAQYPDSLLLMHFVGASSASADWAAMLRRILGELNRHFSLELDVPDEASELRAAFANGLHRAAASGPLVLILDGLNQLEDRDRAPDLVWLPPEIPSHVRLVVSALPGRPLDELRKRSWPTFAIELLTPDERVELIRVYLAQYTKELSESHVDRLAAAPQTASPLFLRALLEELRLFGEHELLEQRIAYHLAAGDASELYGQILARYEVDYERERRELVRDATTFLWAARRGLAEAELLDLLGEAGDSLPGAYWAPLRLAAEQALVSRAGLLGFSHDYLRQAVEDRYVGSEEEQRDAHQRVADYFAGRELGPRKVDELPWQLARAEAWPRLYEVLADVDFLGAAWEADQFELKARWAELEASSPFRMVDAYRPVVDTPEEHEDDLWCVAPLLQTTGYLEEALGLRRYIGDRYREAGERAGLGSALGNQALIFRTRGDLDGAMALLKEHEEICRELGDLIGLESALANQSLILQTRGDLDGAMALLEEQEGICRELGSRDGLQRSLGNQANVLFLRGDLDGATALLGEQERICRELGDQDSLMRSLGNQGNVLHARGDLDGAVALQKEVEGICRRLGSKDGLQASLGNQGIYLTERGDLDGAMTLLEEQERICRELGKRDDLALSFGNQAMVLDARGDSDGAIALHKQAEEIYRELGNRDGLARSFGNQAGVLQRRGDLDEALALYEKGAQIYRDLGRPARLQDVLGAQATIVQARGNLDAAIALREEQVELCRQLGDRNGLIGAVGAHANLLFGRGDLDGALVLHQAAEQLCRELGKRDDLAISLGNQAGILREGGDLDGALVLLEEQEGICRELGDPERLQRSLGKQAQVLKERGDLERALALLEEQERLCRQLEDLESLQGALESRALILKGHGDFDRAMGLLKEQEGICRQLGDQYGLQRSLQNQSTVLRAWGDLSGAMALLEEQEGICRELGDEEGRMRSVGGQALILHARGDLDGAMRLHKVEERIARELDHLEGLQGSLGNQAALILRRGGGLDEASELLAEQERICRELRNWEGLQVALGNQAVILQLRGDLDGAMTRFQEQEQICRDIGNPAALWRSLVNQANVLHLQDDPAGAMPLHQEAESICRTHGLPEGLATSLANQASLLTTMGRIRDAVALAEEAYELAARHGLTALARQIEPILDSARAQPG